MRKLFIDLDDVLNRFTEDFGLRQNLGSDWYQSVTTYNLQRHVEEFTGEQYDPVKFWDLPEWFWAGVRKSDLLDPLMSFCKQHKVQAWIATKPTKHPSSMSGKLKWMHRNLPEWMHERFFVTPEKHVLGATQGILIDDNPKNLEDWREHAYTDVIPIRRPWNQIGYDDPDEIIRRLEDLL